MELACWGGLGPGPQLGSRVVRASAFTCLCPGSLTWKMV